jgi:hypothetical protein
MVLIRFRTASCSCVKIFCSVLALLDDVRGGLRKVKAAVRSRRRTLRKATQKCSAEMQIVYCHVLGLQTQPSQILHERDEWRKYAFAIARPVHGTHENSNGKRGRQVASEMKRLHT